MVATTVTTITTATTASGGLMALSFAWTAVVMVALIVLLVSKELASASDHPRARWVLRVSNVGIVPLIFALAGIVIAKLVKIF